MLRQWCIAALVSSAVLAAWQHGSSSPQSDVREVQRTGLFPVVQLNPRASYQPSPKIASSPNIISTNPLCVGANLAVTQLTNVCDPNWSMFDQLTIVSDTILYCAYSSDQVYFARSLDWGNSWQDSIQLSQGTGVEFNATLVASGSNVFVTWERSDFTAAGVYFASSYDRGATWNPRVGIAIDDHWGDLDSYGSPGILANDTVINILYAAYYTPRRDLVLSVRSVDSGRTWRDLDTLLSGISVGDHIEMAGNAGTKYATFEAERTSPANGELEIYFTRLLPNGEWSLPISISDFDSIPSQLPAICAAPTGEVFVSWFDYKTSELPGTGDIYLRESPDGGATWLPIENAVDVDVAIRSSLDASSGRLTLIWSEDPPSAPIKLKQRSLTSGVWTGPFPISDTTAEHEAPSIRGDGVNMALGLTARIGGFRTPRAGLFYGVRKVGDINGDLTFDILDVTLMIDRAFRGVPPIAPGEVYDANGDGAIDVLDVVTIIGVAFRGGATC